MGIIHEENFDGSSSRPGSSTDGDEYGDRNESFLAKQMSNFVRQINE